MNPHGMDALAKMIAVPMTRQGITRGIAALGTAWVSSRFGTGIDTSAKSSKAQKKARKREKKCQSAVRADCNRTIQPGTNYAEVCYRVFTTATPVYGKDCCAEAKKSAGAAERCLVDHRVQYCAVLASTACPGVVGTDLWRFCHNRVLSCCAAAPQSLAAVLACACPDCTYWPFMV